MCYRFYKILLNTTLVAVPLEKKSVLVQKNESAAEWIKNLINTRQLRVMLLEEISTI